MKSEFEGILVITLMGVTLILAVLYGIVYLNSEVPERMTVTDKERITSSEESKYLVWSTEETFEITDTVLFWRFNSSDLYGSLEIGKKYCMNVAGWRVPILSWYRNIIEITPCPSL